MNDSEIKASLEKAKIGIYRYHEIMNLFHSVDVSINLDFQKKFNAFYRVRQRNSEWYNAYYSLMQQSKCTTPVFGEILDSINRLLGRYEPSFSSKLLATIDPNRPIWDIHILKNTGHKAPAYSSKNKFNEAKKANESIDDWYKKFLDTEDGRRIIHVFNTEIYHHAKISDVKKVDFILWQTRV